MSKKQTRKSYSKEFKLDVIAQSYQRENIRELATELGLPQLLFTNGELPMVVMVPKHFLEKASKN